MSKELGEFENETQKILSESFDKVYQNETDENEEIDNEEVTEEEVDTTEETTEDSSEDEEKTTEEDVADDEETEKEEVNFKDSLKGVFNNDYIDLLESVEDLELRNRLVDAGKAQRADLDRKRLELGESNKLVSTLDEAVKNNGLNYSRQQYAQVVKNFMDFDALYTKDPKQAIEALANKANIDLTSYGSKTVQQSDDYDGDYRTPEEIARDEKLEALERKLNQYENQQYQQSQISVQQELNDFANAKDEQGNLKYPHFDRVRTNMALFFNDSNPDMTMELAYQKAIRLDDELYSQSQKSILEKEEQKRKMEIEKAKKLKKQSVRSSKINSANKTPRKALESIVDELGFG